MTYSRHIEATESHIETDGLRWRMFLFVDLWRKVVSGSKRGVLLGREDRSLK